MSKKPGQAGVDVVVPIQPGETNTAVVSVVVQQGNTNTAVVVILVQPSKTTLKY